MTKVVMEQALDALQIELQNYDGPVPHIDCAITALLEALAQPQQESQCKWPTCQSETTQQGIAAQVKRELREVPWDLHEVPAPYGIEETP